MKAHYKNNEADSVRAIKRLRLLISIILLLIACMFGIIAWTLFY